MIERFPVIPLLIATSLIMFTLAIFSWSKRFIGNSAIFLSLSLLGVAFYNFGYAMELASDSFIWIIWWVRFQHLGIFLIAPTWLLFSISVSGYKNRINLKFIIALSIIPIILFLMAQTLGWLNLAHHNPRLDALGPYQVLAYDRNLFNHISIGYYTLCLAVSTVLFAMMYFRSAPSARKHASIYLIGSLPPYATMIVYNLNLVPSGLDFTPLLLGVSAFIFAFALFKFRILDLIPLARNAIFEDMTTGVLIADTEGQIIDFNPAFETIFNQIGAKPKSSVAELFADYPKLTKWLEEKSTERISFQLSKDEKITYYRVSWSEITDRRLRVIGRLISFDENTKEKLLLDKLEMMASHDGLTGIFNRQHFDQLGNKELSRVQRYGGDLSLLRVSNK